MRGVTTSCPTGFRELGYPEGWGNIGGRTGSSPARVPVIAVLRVPCLSPVIKRVDNDDEEEEVVEKVGASGLER